MPDTPVPNTTDITPAQGDELVQALERARAGVPGSPDDSEIAADDMGQTAAAEQMNKDRPPPIG